jgi:formate dehydrogenase subunit gamma
VATRETDRVLRFRRPEVLMHWSIAVPFLVCWTSALVLVTVYNPDPLGRLRIVFAWIHRVSGLCLIGLPTLVLVSYPGEWRIHLDNIRRAWLWTCQDLRWLSRIALASVTDRVSLPEAGKFNAGEKLNFMMVMTSYPLLIATGILIWLPDVAFGSWLIHCGLAAVVTPVMLGHLVMATLIPDTRKGLSGMVSGYVDRTWARRHYAVWYREQFGEEEAAGPDEEAAAPTPSAAPAVAGADDEEVGPPPAGSAAPPEEPVG